MRYFVQILLLVSSYSLFASNHSISQFRTTVNYSFTERVKASLELQHRRQGLYNQKTCLDDNLLLSYRTWFHYDITDDVHFSLSPYATFTHYGFNITPETPNYTRKEHRYSTAINLEHTLLGRIHMIDRTALELRKFEDNPNVIIRVRTKLGAKIDATEKLSIIVYDEIFLNAKGKDMNHFFDQDRIGLSAVYRFSKKYKLEFGCLHQKRLPSSMENMVSEKSMILNFSYNIIRS